MATFVVVAALFLPNAVIAADVGSEPSLLNVTVGRVGLDRKVSSPGRYGIELRLRPLGRYRLVPAFGFARADNGASFVYGEVKRDFPFANGIIVTPSFGLGRFDASADFQLGQALEFRSGLEIAYDLNGRYRVGLALYHLSNGGLGAENPGSESAALSISRRMD